MSETILIADDIPANRELLRQTLESVGYEILLAIDGESALRAAHQARPDLILLDVLMPKLDGYATCRQLKAAETTAQIPVLFITAQHEMASVLEGFRAGGLDYITKPFQPDEVLARVRTHLGIRRLNHELVQANAELKKQIQKREQAEVALESADRHLTQIVAHETERWRIEGFIGESSAVKLLLQDVRKLQAMDRTNVMIMGESGTGKELIARALHYGGLRAKAPFRAVNCAAIPLELAESELFGHEKGSFSGAGCERRGEFELADGGTLFLDEVGDMPLLLQAKLLRVIEDGRIRRVGASREIQVNVRIVCATNRPLQRWIEEGKFRGDLYHRLAQFPLHVPALRERRGDIALLAEHLARRLVSEMGKAYAGFGPGVTRVLEQQNFPGNVRELRTLIERALIRNEAGVIQVDQLGIDGASTHSQAGKPAVSRTASNLVEVPINLAEAQKKIVEHALELTGQNLSQAAELLGVDRGWIYRLQRKQQSD